MLTVSEALVALVVEHSDDVLLGGVVAGDASHRIDIGLSDIRRFRICPTHVVEHLGAVFEVSSRDGSRKLASQLDGHVEALTVLVGQVGK